MNNTPNLVLVVLSGIALAVLLGVIVLQIMELGSY